MPIFKKRVIEYSTADFAIKADTKAEADKAFEDFFNDAGQEYEDYRDHMNMTMTDLDIDLPGYEDEETYNKLCKEGHDFWIEAPKKKKEPLYDLYIIKDDDPYKTVKLCCPLSEVLNTLISYNVDYTMKLRTDYRHADSKCYAEAVIAHDATLLIFDAERKKN